MSFYINEITIKDQPLEVRNQIMEAMTTVIDGVRTIDFSNLVPIPDEIDTDLVKWKMDNWGCIMHGNYTKETTKNDEMVIKFRTYPEPPQSYLDKLIREFPLIEFHYAFRSYSGDIQFSGRMIADVPKENKANRPK